MFKITPLEISGAFLVENEIFPDERGSFRELMRFSQLSEISSGLPWKQNNLSVSKINTIRGIHFSKSRIPQNKLVSCINGKILDFVVDIRPESPTFRKFCEIELDSNFATSVFIPGGLGHAFIAKTDDAIVNYLLTSEYEPDSEFSINPFDQELAINWGVDNYTISDKDRKAPHLTDVLKNRIL